MKNKKTELVYVPLDTVHPSEVDFLLAKNLRDLLRRGLSAEIKWTDPFRIVGIFEEDFTKRPGSFPLNAFIDDRLLDRMQVQSVTITYSGALLPRSSKVAIEPDGLFFNGNFDYLYTTVSPGWYITPIITCLPSKRIVSIFLEIGAGNYGVKNQYRKALIDAESKIERVIRTTKSARQLIQAFRTSPPNPEFIERSIKELYVAICQF